MAQFFLCCPGPYYLENQALGVTRYIMYTQPDRSRGANIVTIIITLNTLYGDDCLNWLR